MRKHAGKFKLRLMNLQHFRIFSETSGIIHKIFSLSEKKKNSHKNGSFFLLKAISFTHSSQISGTSSEFQKNILHFLITIYSGLCESKYTIFGVFLFFTHFFLCLSIKFGNEMVLS